MRNIHNKLKSNIKKLIQNHKPRYKDLNLQFNTPISAVKEQKVKNLKYNSV